MPAETKLFRCLKDNYGVLIHDPASGATAAIDAPEAAPVEAALKATGWKLTDILVTHHHADHTGGIAELKNKYHCRVVAPKAEAGKIPLVDETVSEGDTVSVGKLTANVIETPGHTLGPHHLLVPRRQARLCRRHAVLDRLRPRHRGHAGDDVGVAEEAPRSAGRHAGLLRPRIHAGEHPVRADHRAGQRRADGARGGSGQADRRRPMDHPDHDRRGEGGQSVPARRRAGGRRRRRPCGKPAAEVFAEIRARKNKF